MKKISILGAGSWGLALARSLTLKGCSVTVWSRIEGEINYLTENNRAKNLGDISLPAGITYTLDISAACVGKDVVVFAVPSVFIRSVASDARSFLSPDQIIVNVAKGIENDTLMTMTEVIADELGKNQSLKGVQPVALSGPTHAEEVALDMPTTIVSACKSLSLAKKVQRIFSSETFRVYTNSDVYGVELCGAVKNVIALACGIASGLGYGDNIKAAIITRGLAEISRLGKKMGCKASTFSGLAGLGDLIVTGASKHSRNNKAGFLIGQGIAPELAVQQVGMVVEGLNALPAVIALCNKHGVEMPIVSAVNDVVSNRLTPQEALKSLMTRKYTSE